MQAWPVGDGPVLTTPMFMVPVAVPSAPELATASAMSPDAEKA